MPTPESRGALDPALAEALERLDELVETFEQEPNPDVQERAFELLQRVDQVHRAGLSRLVALLEEAGGPLRERALAEPAVRLLLELYELLPPAAPSPSSLIPLEDVQVISAPRRQWLPAGSLAEVPPDGLRGFILDGISVLLALVDGELHAYRNMCGTRPLPLHPGRREGNLLICPWHRCRYDLATGRRLDRPGDNLTPLPVDVVDGQVRVEISLPPVVERLAPEPGQ